MQQFSLVYPLSKWFYDIFTCVATGAVRSFVEKGFSLLVVSY
jgi:hypothetical protein